MGNEASTGNHRKAYSSSTNPVTLLKAPDGQRPVSMSMAKDESGNSLRAPKQPLSAAGILAERAWGHGVGADGWEHRVPQAPRSLEVINHRTITPTVATPLGQPAQQRLPLVPAAPRAPERRLSPRRASPPLSPSTPPPSASPPQLSLSSFSASPPPQSIMPLGGGGVAPPERRTNPGSSWAIFVGSATKGGAAPVAPERKRKPGAPSSFNNAPTGQGQGGGQPLSVDTSGLTAAQSGFFANSKKHFAQAIGEMSKDAKRQTPPRTTQLNQNVPPRERTSPPVTEREGHGHLYQNQPSPSHRAPNIEWLESTKDLTLDAEGLQTGRRSIKRAGSGSTKPGSGYVSARSFASATYNDSYDYDLSNSVSPTNAVLTPKSQGMGALPPMSQGKALTPTSQTPRSRGNAPVTAPRTGRSDGSKTPTTPKRLTEPGSHVVVAKLTEEALSAHVLKMVPAPSRPPASQDPSVCNVKANHRLSTLPGHLNYEIWFKQTLQEWEEELLEGGYPDQVGWGDETISRVST